MIDTNELEGQEAARQIIAALMDTPEAANLLLEAARQVDSRTDVLNLKTNVDVRLIGPDGHVKQERHLHNLITTAGKTALAAASGGKKLADFTHLAIGSGSTAANAADTTLTTETARAAATITNPTATSIKFSATFAAGTGTGNVREYGELSASSGGTLLNHLVDSADIPKGASDSLQVDITVSLS